MKLKTAVKSTTHPMLFKPFLHKQIRVGIKTQTRRLVKGIEERKGFTIESFLSMPDMYGAKTLYWTAKEILSETHPKLATAGKQIIKCPYGKVGDLLWIKERYDYAGDSPYYFYEFDNIHLPPEMENIPDTGIYKFRNPMFMPKAAARTWLRITDVRVERLKDITEKDAIAEGVELIGDNEEPTYKNYMLHPLLPPEWGTSARESFFSLWKKINGKAYLHANPWVWVIEFEQCEKPEL